MPVPKEIMLASRNQGKLAELAALLAPVGVERMIAYSGDAPLPEEGDSYESNAVSKALAAARSGGWALADDSGIEAESLDWGPGPRSARFVAGDDNARNIALIAAVRRTGKTRARFVAALALVEGPAVRFVTQASLEGRLTAEPRGTAGFGYDPLFIPDGETRTLAEMSAAEKNLISHRARACRSLVEFFESQRTEVGA